MMQMSFGHQRPRAPALHGVRTPLCCLLVVAIGYDKKRKKERSKARTAKNSRVSAMMRVMVIDVNLYNPHSLCT
jgi:hypothetical protein